MEIASYKYNLNEHEVRKVVKRNLVIIKETDKFWTVILTFELDSICAVLATALIDSALRILMNVF